MQENAFAKLHKEKLRKQLTQSQISDLFPFARDIIGLDLLSVEFHKPICDWLTANRTCKRRAFYAPRYGYKSSLMKAEIISEILHNPDVEMLVVSHSLELSKQLVNEIGQQLLKNDSLRELIPTARRPPRKSKWLRDGEFTMPGRTTTSEQPTLKAASTGQDLTGVHVHVVWADDIISRKVVEEMGGVDGIQSWFQNTLVPVVGVGGRVRITGTLWSFKDLYTQTLEDPNWVAMRRGLLESDCKPDPLGEPIKLLVRDEEGGEPRFITFADVIRFKEEMKGDFNGQMLNLPEPEGGRPWKEATHEHFVKSDQIRGRLKQIVVLTDPAPRSFGSANETTQKRRGDGTKDYWAIAVIGYLQQGNLLKRVLLDGLASKDWNVDEGLAQCLRLMQKWDTTLIGIEEGLGAAKAAQGFSYRLTELCRGRGRRVTPLAFKSVQRGKKPRIADLFSLAEEEFFLICQETVNRDFLNLFLSQARNYPHSDHDDLVDAVAYMHDPVLLDWLPKVQFKRQRNPLDDFREDSPEAKRTKYFGI